MHTPAVRLRGWFDREAERAQATVGGSARLRMIVLLASVLGLNTADSATVGAIAAELERGLSLSNTDIGLLVTVTTAIGALATLPMGVLTDRVNRTRLLWISILICLGHPTGATSNGGTGLDRTLLVMLVPLFAAGLLLLLRARRTYPRDVATAVWSEYLIGRDTAG
jgi:MFS family permease